jgi:hypothetical protein
MHCVLALSDVLTRDRPVATVIESLLRGPMRISAPGDCNQAFRQSSGALPVQIGPTTSGSGDRRGATNSDDDGDGDNNRNDDGDERVVVLPSR